MVEAAIRERDFFAKEFSSFRISDAQRKKNYTEEKKLQYSIEVKFLGSWGFLP